MSRVKDDELRVLTLKRRVERAQRLVRQHVKPGVSLADELIAERRTAASRESCEHKSLKRFRTMHVLLFFALLLALTPARSQQLAKRLILKDGSYQLATQWEVKGDRVRYLSAERNDWEELPKDLVDWDATDKFAKDRAAGVPDAEAVQLNKELEAEMEAEQAKTPLVAPGLHLPEEGSVLLLDTFQNQPELVELQQNAGELNRNRTHNILRAAAIPIASGKQTIELPQPHATVQAHVTLPSIYVNVEPSQDVSQPAQPPAGTRQSGQSLPQQPQQARQPEQPWDRFHIVRAQMKGGKRIVGEVKINPLGKTSQQQNLVPATTQRLTGNWVKVTPMEPLAPGEYALVELLGREGMNTYVWDFGVNPSAAANAGALKPDPTAKPLEQTKVP